MNIIDYFKYLINKVFSRNVNENLLSSNSKNYEDELYKEYGKCKEFEKRNVKILFITDTHNCLTYDNETLDKIRNEKDYDICILLGDHSANDLYEITQIIEKEKIYGVLGNHDDWNKYDEYGIENINEKVIDIKGLKIAGIGGSFKYKDSDKYSLYTHEESIEISDKLEYADILVSHDKAFTNDNRDLAHDGLKGITKYIYKNHISIHIHGHLHNPNEEILKNGAKSICLYKVDKIEF